MTSQLLLRFQNISFHFGHDLSTVPALDDISLSIPIGQHTAILGPNGSGKTTLLKLLMRLLYPDPSKNFVTQVDQINGSGSHDNVKERAESQVLIMGRCDWNVWELRKQLGYVSSELDNHFSQGRSGRLSVLDAVLTGFSSGELALNAQEINHEMRANAIAAMGKCRVAPFADRMIAQLSTGERRRVLIARALVHRPLGLILDEPTAGLDIAARTQLLEHLIELGNSGTTLILVTHHIEEVIPIFNRVVLMKKGHIHFEGTRSQALDSVRLSDLFGIKLTILENQHKHIAAVVT